MRVPAFRELALANARELLRDRKTLFLTAAFPFFFLGLFLGIAALVPQEPGAPDLARFYLPAVLFIALTSVAFFGTAVPLVTLREKGTLRLLGTTPVRRSTLLLAQAPARFAVAAGQFVVIAAVTSAMGYLEPGRVPALLGTCLAGLAMLGALGYLFGGRLPSAELANNLLSIITVLALFTSGFMVPLEFLPRSLQLAVEALPTTYLGDLLRHQLTGVEAGYPLWRSYTALLLGAAVFAALAVRTFRWDQGPARP